MVSVELRADRNNRIESTAVGRLRLYVAAVETSLEDEFHHTERVAQEWAVSLRLLLDAVSTVEEAASTQEDGPPWLVEICEVLRHVRREVELAISDLREGRGEPVERIYSALARVSGSRYDLTDLQRTLRASSGRQVPVPQPDPAALDDAREALNKAFRQAQETLIQGTDLERCLASRRLYLHTYFTAVTAPGVWTSEMHEEIIRLNRDLLRCVMHGRARDSVKNRLEALQRYGPESFSLLETDAEDKRVVKE